VVEGGQDDFTRTRQNRWARFHTRHHRLASYADFGQVQGDRDQNRYDRYNNSNIPLTHQV